MVVHVDEGAVEGEGGVGEFVDDDLLGGGGVHAGGGGQEVPVPLKGQVLRVGQREPLPRGVSGSGQAPGGQLRVCRNQSRQTYCHPNAALSTG